MMRKFIICGLSLLIALGITGCESKTIKFKQQSVEIECGEILPEDLLEYVDTSEIDDAKEVTYTSQSIKDFTKPLAVGEYEIEYTYKNKNYPLKISVKDTKAPEVKVKSGINTIENEYIYYEKYLEIQDASKYFVNVNYKQTQFDTKGHYDVNVEVRDQYDNTTNVTVPVDVKEMNLEFSKSNVSLTEGKTAKLKVITNSTNHISYDSSDISVAMVDSYGNVKAGNPGTATITASVSGKKETCYVTVNEKQKAQSTNHYSHGVYKTATGHKYHRAGCRYLSQSQIPISVSEAIDEGLEPCSVCNP